MISPENTKGASLEAAPLNIANGVKRIGPIA